MHKPTLTNDTPLIGLSVYRFALGDCTNGGISATANTLYIPHPQGPHKLADVDVRLVFVPERRGPNYLALIPYADPVDTHPEWKGERRGIGPMAGGNLAHTSDSRGGGLIYHVHDRWETEEQYRALSI